MDRSNPYEPTSTTNDSEQRPDWVLLLSTTMFVLHITAGLFALYVWLRPPGRYSSDVAQSVENTINSVVFIPLFMTLFLGPLFTATLAIVSVIHRRRCIRLLACSLGIASFQLYLVWPYMR